MQDHRSEQNRLGRAYPSLELWNRGGFETFIDRFREDAVLFPSSIDPNEPDALRGHAEIKAYLEEIRGKHYKFEIMDVFIVQSVFHAAAFRRFPLSLDDRGAGWRGRSNRAAVRLPLGHAEARTHTVSETRRVRPQRRHGGPHQLGASSGNTHFARRGHFGRHLIDRFAFRAHRRIAMHIEEFCAAIRACAFQAKIGFRHVISPFSFLRPIS